MGADSKVKMPYGRLGKTGLKVATRAGSADTSDFTVFQESWTLHYPIVYMKKFAITWLTSEAPQSAR